MGEQSVKHILLAEVNMNFAPLEHSPVTKKLIQGEGNSYQEQVLRILLFFVSAFHPSGHGLEVVQQVIDERLGVCPNLTYHCRNSMRLLLCSATARE